jgi:Hydrogenase maturation factor
VAHLLKILEVEPAVIAHDLHPDFYSTRLAVRLTARRGARLHAVQHHHAHIAAVLAEHRVQSPAIGLAMDGVGLGSDGAAWGGELMRVDGAAFIRLGRLRPLRLPGGDRQRASPGAWLRPRSRLPGARRRCVRASPTNPLRRQWP